MMKDTDAVCGDASLSVTVMVTGYRFPLAVGVPLTTPLLKLSPGGRTPVTDQLYGSLPPDSLSDRVNDCPTVGNCVPGLPSVSVG